MIGSAIAGAKRVRKNHALMVSSRRPSTWSMTQARARNGAARRPAGSRLAPETTSPRTNPGRRAARSIATYPPSDSPTTTAAPAGGLLDDPGDLVRGTRHGEVPVGEGAVPGQVDGDDAIGVAQVVHLRTPHRPGQARAVDEHDRQAIDRPIDVVRARSSLIEGRSTSCWTARSAACVRLESPSLARMFDTWVRAVRSVMPRSSAIARFESPRAMPARTSRSRAVRLPSASEIPVSCRAAGLVAHASRDDPRDDRIEVHFARRRSPDRRGQLVRLGVLEQEARRAGFEGRHDARLLDEAGDRDDLDVRVRGLDPHRRVDAVDARHHEVHDDDIGSQAGGLFDRPGAVRGLADDLEIVMQRQEIAHAPPDHGVVVDEQDADRCGW